MRHAVGPSHARLPLPCTAQLVYLTTVKHSVQPEAACVSRDCQSQHTAPADPPSLRRSATPAALVAADGDSGGEDARLNAALSGLTLVRLLAENADCGPPCIRARLLRAFDAPAALAAVLAAKPWYRQRRTHGGSVVTQHLEGGTWVSLPPGARPAGGIPSSEAHSWLALLHLLSPASTAGLDPHAVARSFAAAAHALTPAALEALPPLEWLSRAAQQQQLQQEQHSSMASGGAAGGRGSSLLLSLVPPVREALLRATDWEAVVAGAQGGVFGDTPAAEERARGVAAAQAAVWDETLWAAGKQEQQAAAGPAGAAPPGGVRVDVVPPGDDVAGSRGWHFQLDVDGDAPPQEVSLQLPSTPAPVTGLRWRLSLPSQLRRLVPEAVLRCTLPRPGRSPSGATSQQLSAQLALPGGASTRSAAPGLHTGDVDVGAAWAAAPPVVWVTVGALATDGAVLQLRCARVESAGDVGLDAEGALLMYRPAGGALSVRH